MNGSKKSALAQAAYWNRRIFLTTDAVPTRTRRRWSRPIRNPAPLHRL